MNDLYVGTAAYLFLFQLTQKILLKILCIVYKRCVFYNKINYNESEDVSKQVGW